MTPFDWPVGNPVLFLAAVRRLFNGTEAVGSIWDDITLSPDQTIVVNLTGSTIVPPEILDDLITIAQSSGVKMRFAPAQVLEGVQRCHDTM